MLTMTKQKANKIAKAAGLKFIGHGKGRPKTVVPEYDSIRKFVELSLRKCECCGKHIWESKGKGPVCRKGACKC